MTNTPTTETTAMLRAMTRELRLELRAKWEQNPEATLAQLRPEGRLYRWVAEGCQETEVWGVL
jgi:hypothetical protein